MYLWANFFMFGSPHTFCSHSFLFYVYLFIYIVIYLSFYASMAIYLFIFIFIIVPDNYYFFFFVSKSFIIFAHLQGTVTFHDWHCLLVGTVNYLEVPTFCVVFHWWFVISCLCTCMFLFWVWVRLSLIYSTFPWPLNYIIILVTINFIILILKAGYF